MARFIRSDITTLQNLADAALSYTTSIARKFRLDQINIKFSANVTEKITITLDSINGATYDIVLDEKTVIGKQNYIFDPADGIECQSGDEIKVACTNANTAGTAYVTIKTSEIN